MNELAPECTSKQIMDLIRRGDIPPYYEEQMEYDNKSHRMKARPDCFYLDEQICHYQLLSKICGASES